jgi:hypothetical protein
MQDDEDLRAEMEWRPPLIKTRSSWRNTPPGVNVIGGIGLLFFVPALVLVMSITEPSDSLPGSFGRLLLWGGGILLVAGFLAKWTWLAIGPRARTALRPLGRLGPGGMVVALLVLAYLCYSLVLPFTRDRSPDALAGGPLSGDDFSIETASGGRRVRRATLLEARRHCTSKGPGWRIPRAGDEAFLSERIQIHYFRKMGGMLVEPEPPKPGAPDGRTDVFIWDGASNRFTRARLDPKLERYRTEEQAVVCVRD